MYMSSVLGEWHFWLKVRGFDCTNRTSSTYQQTLLLQFPEEVPVLCGYD